MVTSCVTLFKRTGALRDERTTARETIKKRSGLGGKSKSVQTKGLCNNYQEGAEKLEGGALHKIAAKIGGAQSRITHLTEGGP